MSYLISEYVCLVLRTKHDGDQITLKVLRATADFYGWTEAFPEWQPRVHPTATHRYIQVRGRGPWRPHIGGKRLTISRAATRMSKVPGMTNVFRISTDAANQDLRRLAMATKVEWGWMNNMRMRRVPREVWLASSANPSLPSP